MVKKDEIKEKPIDKTKILINLSDDVVKVYQSTIAILEEGIKAGKNNIPLGMVSFIAYIDLLHGGAYSGSVEELPFYSSKVPEPNIRLPLGAKPEQIEAMMNADQPRIFPKLLSDQAYFLIKEWASTVMTVDVLKGVSTGLTTLVEGTSRSVVNASEAAENIPDILKGLVALKGKI